MVIVASLLHFILVVGLYFGEEELNKLSCYVVIQIFHYQRN